MSRENGADSCCSPVSSECEQQGSEKASDSRVPLTRTRSRSTDSFPAAGGTSSRARARSRSVASASNSAALAVRGGGEPLGFMAFFDEESPPKSLVLQGRTRARSKSLVDLAVERKPRHKKLSTGSALRDTLRSSAPHIRQLPPKSPKARTASSNRLSALFIKKKKSPRPRPSPSCSSVILVQGDPGFVDESSIVRLDHIGSGGSGTTITSCYIDGWLCAVKELDLGKAFEGSIADLEKEIELMSALPSASPYLVRMLKAQRTPTNLALFTSLYEQDLSQLLAQLSASRCHLPEQVVVCYCIQLLKGLRHMHDLLILHRDLKSANVFCSRNNVEALASPLYSVWDASLVQCREIRLPNSLVIGDFGEAKRLEGRLERAASVRGTPIFNSPEMLGEATRGKLTKKKASFSSDIWSIGQLMTEMMTLKPPYDKLDHFEAVGKATRGERPELENHILSRYPLLIPIWERILTKEASARPTISVLLMELQEIL